VKIGDVGIITMAVHSDSVIRATALAASVRLTNPGLPVSLLVPEGLDANADKFDSIHHFRLPEPYSGESKLLNKLIHPINLSPYERTLFLDDDTLVVRPLSGALLRLGEGPLNINCRRGPGVSASQLNKLPTAISRARFGPDFLNVYGGGHMYFEDKRDARSAADAALAVAERADYAELAGQSIIADELAIVIAANEERWPMPVLDDFVDAFTLDQANCIDLAMRQHPPRYRWPKRPWGTDIESVCILHFCSRAKRALPYRRAIYELTGLRQSFDRGLSGTMRRIRMAGRASRLRVVS
jgi:hypothetical protein